MKKIMLVFGTRPEAILVKDLKIRKKLNTIVCVTGQHSEMLNQILTAFDLVPEYELSIIKAKQTLFDVTINIFEKMKAVIEEVKPDVDQSEYDKRSKASNPYRDGFESKIIADIMGDKI